MHADNLLIDSGVHVPDFLELVWQWSEQHSEPSDTSGVVGLSRLRMLLEEKIEQDLE